MQKTWGKRYRDKCRAPSEGEPEVQRVLVAAVALHTPLFVEGPDVQLLHLLLEGLRHAPHVDLGTAQAVARPGARPAQRDAPAGPSHPVDVLSEMQPLREVLSPVAILLADYFEDLGADASFNSFRYSVQFHHLRLKLIIRAKSAARSFRNEREVEKRMNTPF